MSPEVAGFATKNIIMLIFSKLNLGTIEVRFWNKSNSYMILEGGSFPEDTPEIRVCSGTPTVMIGALDTGDNFNLYVMDLNKSYQIVEFNVSNPNVFDDMLAFAKNMIKQWHDRYDHIYRQYLSTL